VECEPSISVPQKALLCRKTETLLPLNENNKDGIPKEEDACKMKLPTLLHKKNLEGIKRGSYKPAGISLFTENNVHCGQYNFW